MIVSLIATFSIFFALTLLPLWIGLITHHPRLWRLTLVPVIPYVVSAIFINVIVALSLLGIESHQLLLGIANATGFSAFSLWVVTWALFKKWRIA